MQGLLMQQPGANPPGGLLGPQITPSAPPTFPMPTAQPMPRVTAPPQKGLFSRIMSNLSNLGAPNTPQGYEGLLSSEEIQSARPGFMSRLASITPGAPTPGQQYQGGLDRLVQIKMLAEKIGQDRAAKQQQAAMLANREKIGQQFAPKDGETPQQSVHRLLNLFDAYTRSGDVEMATKTGEVLKSMSNVLDGPKPTAVKLPEWVDFGGEKRLVEPTTGEVLKVEKKTPVPYDRAATAEPLAQVVDETGDAIWVPRSQAVGQRAKASQVSTGKPTESQEKSYLFYNLMKSAQPQIEAAMRSGKVRKAAVTAYINAQSVPGVGGLVEAGVNSKLTPEEQSLVRSFRDFAAGVLRKESGAAVTAGELREVWARFGPGFGDNPALDDEKSKSRTAYMESMRNVALPAIEYYQKRNSSSSAPSGSAPPSYEEWLKSKRTP